MHLTSSLRFRGYWLGLLGWLVLTFASPLSAALAEEGQSWMRLCSAMGVQWVQLSNDEPSQQDNCQCLTMALTADVPKVRPVIPLANLSSTVAYKAPVIDPSYFKPLSRASPPDHRG